VAGTYGRQTLLNAGATNGTVNATDPIAMALDIPTIAIPVFVHGLLGLSASSLSSIAANRNRLCMNSKTDYKMY